MSTLIFDIAQYFTLLNYQLFLLVLNKAGFNLKIFSFFSNYLIGKKTQYLQNNFVFSLFNINIDVRQGSTLFSILSALYILIIFHIFKKRSKNLKISVSLLCFVGDRLLISQEKSFEKTNALLFCSYNIILSLLNQLELMIEDKKSKVFHFSRSYRIFNPSSLNFSLFREPILCPKDIQRYLGFIFDRKLSFQQHIKFYSNKVLSTVKYIKMLEKLTRKLLSHQK